MSSSPILIFADRFAANANDSSWKSKLKQVPVWLLANMIKRQVRAVNSDVVFTFGAIANRLRFSSSNNIEARDLDVEVYPYASHANYLPLHQFADALYRLSELAGPEGGLSYHDLPILKLLEIRWLEPLFIGLLVYGDIIGRVLEETHPARIRTIGKSALVSLIADIAHSRGVPVSACPLPWYAHHLHKNIDGGSVLYQEMAQHDLSALPVRADTSAFDRVGSPRILFIGGFNRTVERLRAALMQIKAHCESEIYLLAWRRVTLTETLKGQGMACSYVNDWLSEGEGRRLIERAGVWGREGWRIIQSVAATELPHTWQRIRIYPYAEPFLRATCLEGIKRAVFVAEVANRVINHCRPNLVVTFEDWELMRAITLLSRQRGIPTLTYYNLSNNIYSGLIRRTQEWMAVSGKILYNAFLPQYPPDHIRIIGDTLADRILTASRNEVRAKICSELSLSKHQPLVVLLSTYPTIPITLDDIRILFQRTFHAARQIRRIQVVIKAHPGQSLKSVRQWMAAWNCSGTLVQDCDLLDLCLAADLVSAPITTAVWQAMLARTPVVSIQPRALLEQFENMGFDYLKGKGIVYIPPESDPVPIFEKLLFDTGSRQAQIERGLLHVSEHIGPADGHAAHRLAQFIAEIMQSNTNAQ
jgi:hypothetical protein